MSAASSHTRRWKRVEYEQLIDRGIFQPDERLEEAHRRPAPRAGAPGRHPRAGHRAVAEALRDAFGTTARIRVQLPIALDEESEPEPDVSVVSGPLADADAALPSRALLIVEVSDSSLALDRTEKASLYARARIADYWILNLPERMLEVHREPTPEPTALYGWRYSLINRLAAGHIISPLAAPGSRIPVARLTR